MVRGVSFRVPDEVGSLLYDAVQMINFNKYFWRVDSEEVYTENQQGIAVPLFNNRVYNGIEFVRKIKLNKYYAMFAEIKAFPQGSRIVEIANFDEFINSDCDLVLLVSAGTFFEVYCKDDILSKMIFKNAAEHKFSEISYIDEYGYKKVSI